MNAMVGILFYLISSGFLVAISFLDRISLVQDTNHICQKRFSDLEKTIMMWSLACKYNLSTNTNGEEDVDENTKYKTCEDGRGLARSCHRRFPPPL